MKQGLIRIIGITSFIVGMVAVRAIFNAAYTETTTIDPQAAKNTAHNAAVSACVKEAGTMPDARSFCECAMGKVEQLHPDWTTDTELQKRVASSGYNQAETDAIVTCVK